MARSLEISCLETSVKVGALILQCSRGRGGNIWAQVATSGHVLPSHGALSILYPPRAKIIPSPKHPPVLGASPGARSILWYPEHHTEPRTAPGAQALPSPGCHSTRMGPACRSHAMGSDLTQQPQWGSPCSPAPRGS